MSMSHILPLTPDSGYATADNYELSPQWEPHTPVQTTSKVNTGIEEFEPTNARPRSRPGPIIAVQEVDGFPPSSSTIPAHLSCYELCQQYPNSLYGENLDPFIQHNFSCTQVYECLPKEVQQVMKANHKNSKNPSNAIAKRMTKRRNRLEKHGILKDMVEGEELRAHGLGGEFRGNGRFPLGRGVHGLPQRRKKTNAVKRDSEQRSRSNAVLLAQQQLPSLTPPMLDQYVWPQYSAITPVDDTIRQANPNPSLPMNIGGDTLEPVYGKDHLGSISQQDHIGNIISSSSGTYDFDDLELDYDFGGMNWEHIFSQTLNNDNEFSAGDQVSLAHDISNNTGCGYFFDNTRYREMQHPFFHATHTEADGFETTTYEQQLRSELLPPPTFKDVQQATDNLNRFTRPFVDDAVPPYNEPLQPEEIGSAYRNVDKNSEMHVFSPSFSNGNQNQKRV